MGKKRFYGWVNVAIFFFIYFIVAGLIQYGLAVIFPEMVRTMGWKRGDAAIANSTSDLLIGLLLPAGAWILNRLGARKTMVIGLSTGVLALLLLGTATSQLWHWIVIWGVVMPVVFILGGVLPMQTTLMFWFNMRRATAMGIVMTGGSVGGAVASPLFTWLLTETGSWKSAWLASAVFVVLALILLTRVRNKPEELGQFPDGRDSEAAESAPSVPKKPTRTYQTAATWNLRDVIRTRQFYFFFLILYAQIMPLALLQVHGVFHLTDIGFTPMQAASAISFMLLGGSLARFPMGFLGDRIEPRWILSAVYFFMFPSMMGIWKAPYFPLLLASALVFGFCFGTSVVMVPTLIGNYFGPDSFANIAGIGGPFLVLFCAPMAVVSGYTADYFGSYDAIFIFVGGVIAVGTLAALLLAPPVPKTGREEVEPKRY
ncbi:MAG: MFS transporter [Proteobacteria bacterium]|nr:MFS transporter [Pseudomonadota bacterium]